MLTARTYRRRNFRSPLAALLLASALPLFAAAQDPQANNGPRVARLGMIQGDVQVQLPGEQTAERAAMNLPLQQGVTLATGTGVAEVEFENGAVGYLGDNAVVQFTQLGFSATAQRITRLTQTQGTARFFSNLAPTETFGVLTPDVTVSPQGRADFRLDVYRDGTTVTLLQGQALVTSGGASWTVQSGQMLSIRSGELQAAITPSPPVDDFGGVSQVLLEKWLNPITEEKAPQFPGPPPFSNAYGMADLYTGGSWFFIPVYGWGWRPRVGPDWLPFQNGFWITAASLGLTWVSNEPWGWLPYHFGGWLYTPEGWVWIPGKPSGWQPAAVAWVNTGKGTGWVAASPLDQPNKTPVNLARGVLVSQRRDGGTVSGNSPAIIPGATRLEPTNSLRILPSPSVSAARQLAVPLPPVPPRGPQPATTSFSINRPQRPDVALAILGAGYSAPPSNPFPANNRTMPVPPSLPIQVAVPSRSAIATPQGPQPPQAMPRAVAPPIFVQRPTTSPTVPVRPITPNPGIQRPETPRSTLPQTGAQPGARQAPAHRPASGNPNDPR